MPPQHRLELHQKFTKQRQQRFAEIPSVPVKTLDCLGNPPELHLQNDASVRA